jgi:hypothetical protein
MVHRRQRIIVNREKLAEPLQAWSCLPLLPRHATISPVAAVGDTSFEDLWAQIERVERRREFAGEPAARRQGATSSPATPDGDPSFEDVLAEIQRVERLIGTRLGSRVSGARRRGDGLDDSFDSCIGGSDSSSSDLWENIGTLETNYGIRPDSQAVVRPLKHRPPSEERRETTKEVSGQRPLLPRLRALARSFNTNSSSREHSSPIVRRRQPVEAWGES